MAEAEKWYVIKVAERYEAKAVNFCLELRETSSFATLRGIQEFKIPRDFEGKPIIPGYVFLKVHLTPAIYYQLPRIPFFNYWVGVRPRKFSVDDLKKMSPLGARFPKPLSEEDLARLDKIAILCADKSVNDEIIARNLIPGGFYTINQGPMEGIKCVFKSLDDNDPTIAHVQVLVFQRPVPMTIEITSIGERVKADDEMWEAYDATN